MFRDALSVTVSDPRHSTEEDRFVTIGRADRDRTLVVVHSEVGGAISNHQRQTRNPTRTERV